MMMKGTSRLPLGFKDLAQFAAFKADLEQAIDELSVKGKPITALVGGDRRIGQIALLRWHLLWRAPCLRQQLRQLEAGSPS